MAAFRRLKPVEWIASSRDHLRSFPWDVRAVVGEALYRAQQGGEHPAAKALKGFGGRGVLEVIDDFDGDTFRAEYTVRFAEGSFTCCMHSKRNLERDERPRSKISN